MLHESPVVEFAPGEVELLACIFTACKSGESREVVVRIRTAEYSDVESLRAYAEALFAERLPGIYDRPTPTPEEEIEFVRSHLEPPNSTLLVAESEGRILGILGFLGRHLAEESHVGEMGHSVAREHRGKGIGSALIEALVAWAPPHGISRIECRAWENNPGSLRLYRRMAFDEEGRARGAIIRDGEPLDVHLLARLLSNAGTGPEPR